MSEISNLAQLGSPIFAAIAAGASWSSVVLSQREARERRQPNLQTSELSIIGSKPSDHRGVSLVVLNAGAGVARSAAFVLAGGDEEYCSHSLGSGFLRYQDTARVKTEMQPDGTVRALAICRDLGKRTLAWDLQGNRKSYKGSTLDPARNFQTFWSDFYGDDLSTWRRIGSEVSSDS